MRNTAISLLRLAGWTNIAAALRHPAREPDRLINLVLTSRNTTSPEPCHHPHASDHPCMITGVSE